MSQTHKNIRNAIVAEFVKLQDEKATLTTAKDSTDARLVAIGSGAAGLGGVDPAANPALPTGELGDLVNGLKDLLDPSNGGDAGYSSVTPTISGFLKASIAVVGAVTATQVIRGTDFLPFPLVKLVPAAGPQVDVSASVTLSSSVELTITLPANAVGTDGVGGPMVYAVSVKNPLDSTASTHTSVPTFTFLRS